MTVSTQCLLVLVILLAMSLICASFRLGVDDPQVPYSPEWSAQQRDHPQYQLDGVPELDTHFGERTPGKLLQSFSMNTAKSQHPRLRVLETDVDRIRHNIKQDPVAAAYYAEIKRQGEEILREPPRVRPAPKPGGHILDTSRSVLDRVYTLGILYRLSDPTEDTWALRAWRELESAANFSDWNPPHYLDVAEMTHAVAVGYDWLYDFLNEEQRKTLEVAIEEKGFKTAIDQFKQKAKWTYYPDNWNNVCSGAMIIAYLAVFDTPETCPSAETVKGLVSKDLPNALASYGPQGAWPEGVNYWAYATKYTVAAASSLQTALGSDQGIGEVAGFNETGLFMVHATAPSLQYFNYADAGTYSFTGEPSDTPSVFYLASRYGLPSVAYLQRLKVKRSGQLTNLDLIYYTPIGNQSDLDALPTCKVYSRWSIFTARSSWSDPNATWIGLKAGITHAGNPHGHLDVGSFVMETRGRRWAIDLGADSYSLPGYFGHQRFSYYRLRNIGHNTLTFDDDNQAENASCPLKQVINCPPTSVEGGDKDSGDLVSVDADLSNAYYPSGVKSVYRQFNMTFSTRELLVYDRIDYGQSTAKTLTWALHTGANITITNSSSEAQLSIDAQYLTVRMVSDRTQCRGARFSAQDVDLKPPQRSSKGVRKLMIQAEAKSCETLLVSLKW